MIQRRPIGKGLIFLVLFIANYGLHAQLVNIESKRMQTDSTRFALTSDLLFNYTDNNDRYVIQIRSNLTAQFKSRDLKRIYFVIGDYNLIKSQAEDFQNSWFFHARYNQKLTPLLRWEAFFQNQYNAQLTVTHRNLVGTGLRLKLASSPTTAVYFGNAYMYEIETIESISQQFYNHRNSSYLSVNRFFEKPTLNITGTVYFQPLYKAIGDHRALAQVKAEIPLTERLSLSALYNYFYTNFSGELSDDRASTVNFGFTLKI